MATTYKNPIWDRFRLGGRKKATLGTEDVENTVAQMEDDYKIRQLTADLLSYKTGIPIGSVVDPIANVQAVGNSDDISSYIARPVDDDVETQAILDKTKPWSNIEAEATLPEFTIFAKDENGTQSNYNRMRSRNKNYPHRQKYLDENLELRGLINNVANWEGVDPNLLGSALAEEGIIDRIINLDDKMPDKVNTVDLFGLDSLEDWLNRNEQKTIRGLPDDLRKQLTKENSQMTPRHAEDHALRRGYNLSPTDSMRIVANVLKNLKKNVSDQYAKDNLSNEDLNALAYGLYNAGENRENIKSMLDKYRNRTLYNVKKFGGRRKAEGGTEVKLTPYNNYIQLNEDTDFYTPTYMRFWNWYNANKNSNEAKNWLNKINNKEFGEIGGNTFTADDILRLAHDYKKGPVHNAFSKAAEDYAKTNAPSLGSYLYDSNGNTLNPYISSNNDTTDFTFNQSYETPESNNPTNIRSIIANRNIEIGDNDTNLTTSKSGKAQKEKDSDLKKHTGLRDWFGDITTNDWISLGSNITGGLISSLIRNNSLNKMKYASEPTPRIARKLKTNYNINPSLQALDYSLNRTERDINNNTGSSAAALSRIQRQRLSNMLERNKLYETKENEQTKLINTDRLNQQEVQNKSIEDYNQWSKDKAIWRNDILQQKANNWINNLVNPINAGVQNIISNMENRRKDNLTTLAMLAGNKNIPVEEFVKLGVLTEEQAKLYRLMNSLEKQNITGTGVANNTNN